MTDTARDEPITARDRGVLLVICGAIFLEGIDVAMLNVALPAIRADLGRGYDHDISRRGVAHGSGLGKQRWVVEHGFAWLHASERLRTRYERRADIHPGLLQPACALIRYRQLAAVLR